MVGKDQDVVQHRQYDRAEDSSAPTCLCGCGGPTKRRFTRGHDSKLRSRLHKARNEGDTEAEALQEYVEGNNDQATFPEQRRRVQAWVRHHRPEKVSRVLRGVSLEAERVDSYLDLRWSGSRRAQTSPGTAIGVGALSSDVALARIGGRGWRRSRFMCATVRSRSTPFDEHARVGRVARSGGALT